MGSARACSCHVVMHIAVTEAVPLPSTLGQATPRMISGSLSQSQISAAVNVRLWDRWLSPVTVPWVPSTARAVGLSMPMETS